MALVDARGVPIEPGDTVIWGYPYGSSIGMAEGTVLEAPPCDVPGCTLTVHETVSLTPSGRVRIRVWWHSMGEGAKSVVDVAPDRLVVLGATTPWSRYRHRSAHAD